MLLSKGAAVNQARDDGATPLYMAAQGGHRAIVELLLSKGGGVNLAEADGGTPLYISAQIGQLVIVELLLSMGADINLATASGATPIFVAAQQGHLRIVEILLSEGAAVNLAIADGSTALYIAAQNGHLVTVEFLLSKGANVNRASANGATPMLIATQQGHLRIVELLLSKGANVNLARADGSTALYIAAQRGLSVIVELLLSKGAKKNICCNGLTPADVTARQGHLGIADLLLSRVTSSPASSDTLNNVLPTSEACAPPADDHSDYNDNAAAEEHGPSGKTEELHQVDELSPRRVEELSCQVQGLRVSGNAPRRACDVCAVEVQKLKRCPCLAALYCSAECQKQAWPSHRAVCMFKKK